MSDDEFDEDLPGDPGQGDSDDAGHDDGDDLDDGFAERFERAFGDEFGDGAPGGPDDAFDAGSGTTPLPDAESWQVAQDLDDLEAFEQVFAAEGIKGVSMWCHDCQEEHFYRWELLRNSLELLLETGEIPVHEPAFQPNPDEYVPWEYARGYIDALRDVGVEDRAPVEACPRCALPLEGPLTAANWCPRCAAPLLGARLAAALDDAGLRPAAIKHVLRAVGLPGQPGQA